MNWSIPTEPIGSIPRHQHTIEALKALEEGRITSKQLEEILDQDVRETITRFEETGSPLITDGEQRKPSFATYPFYGDQHLDSNGVVIPFKDGHTRQLPVITKGQFRYKTYAVEYVAKAKNLTKLPLKQAVISASALSLLYPKEGLAGYSQEEFLADLINEAEKDIRQCLNAGVNVQIDFTEGRLAVKLDPSKALLKSFIELNNRVLDRFSYEERRRIGVHTCPGGDHDSTHSLEVDYADFLPDLFQLNVGQFYLQFSSESDRKKVLKIIKPFASTPANPRRFFLGVTDPISKRIESPIEIMKTICDALEFIPVESFGTTDDCGFSPFCDDVSTDREMAFMKIRSRVEGTKLAHEFLGLRYQ